MSSLDRKVALVTGAAGGTGAAICHRLSKEGAFIVTADMSFDGARSVAEQIRKAGRRLRTRISMLISTGNDQRRKSIWRAGCSGSHPRLDAFFALTPRGGIDRGRGKRPASYKV
jgi:NAD(P)-dependent dehydrogenase (short-subunit alcohol dehydrogenase family)